METGSGQRGFKRSELKSVARVFPQGETKGFEAYVRGISRSGLGVYSKCLLEVNREVTARLQFTNAYGQIVVESVAGRVVWLNSWEDAYLMGIEFKELIHPEKNPGLFAHVAPSEGTALGKGDSEGIEL
jgi:hypothetical protein